MSGNRQRDLERRRPTPAGPRELTAAEVAIARSIQAERERRQGVNRLATEATVATYALLAADAILAHTPTEAEPVPSALLLQRSEQARLAGLYLLEGLGLGKVNGATPEQPEAGENPDGADPAPADDPPRESPIVLP